METNRGARPGGGSRPRGRQKKKNRGGGGGAGGPFRGPVFTSGGEKNKKTGQVKTRGTNEANRGPDELKAGLPGPWARGGFFEGHPQLGPGGGISIWGLFKPAEGRGKGRWGAKKAGGARGGGGGGPAWQVARGGGQRGGGGGGRRLGGWIRRIITWTEKGPGQPSNAGGQRRRGFEVVVVRGGQTTVGGGPGFVDGVVWRGSQGRGFGRRGGKPGGGRSGCGDRAVAEQRGGGGPLFPGLQPNMREDFRDNSGAGNPPCFVPPGEKKKNALPNPKDGHEKPLRGPAAHRITLLQRLRGGGREYPGAGGGWLAGFGMNCVRATCRFATNEILARLSSWGAVEKPGTCSPK